MGQRSKPRGCFTQKTYAPYIYSWCPDTSLSKQTSSSTNGSNQPNFFCTAIPYSQGQDWIVTYVYNLIVVNNQQERSAYVECDYVK